MIRVSLPVVSLGILLLSGLINPLPVPAQDFADKNVDALHQSLKDVGVMADKGDPKSQTKMGMIAYYGFGGAPDYTAALGWFQKAADQNYPEAMVQLGNLYENGLGVEVDLDKARELYNKAAKLEYPQAQFRLAMLEMGSPEGEADEAAGRALLDLSCKTGYQTACATLLYLDNDFSQARNIFDRECKSGEQIACAILAQIPTDEFIAQQAGAEGSEEKGSSLIYIGGVLLGLLLLGVLVFWLGPKEEEAEVKKGSDS